MAVRSTPDETAVKRFWRLRTGESGPTGRILSLMVEWGKEQKRIGYTQGKFEGRNEEHDRLSGI